MKNIDLNDNLKDSLNEQDLKQFDDISKNVKKVLSSAKKDQATGSYRAIAELDMKFAKKLEEAGKADLAKSIIAEAPKHNNATKPQSKKIMWFSLSFATLSVLLVGFAIVGFYAGWFDGLLHKPTVGTLSQLADEKPLPLITLRPDKVSANGYVEQSNKFTIKVAGTIEGDAASQLTIEPKIDAKISAQQTGDGTEITVEPSALLERGKDYQVSLKEGTKFDNGAELKRDLTWSVTVEPYFSVLGTTPSDGAENVPVNTAIEFEFNHKNIDAAKIAQYVSFNPAISGKFEVSGMKIVFLPDGLNANTTYNAKLSKDFSDGNDEKLGSDSLFTFKTGDSGNSLSDKPFINWEYSYRSQLITNSTENVSGVVNFGGIKGNVNFTVYSLSEDQFIKSMVQNKGVLTGVPEGASQVNAQSKSGAVQDVYMSFEFKPANYGIYLVEVGADGVDGRLYKVIVYSKLGIVSNITDTASSVWAFDMPSSKVVENIGLKGYSFDSTDPISSVSTDGSGYASLPKTDFIIAKRGNDEYAITSSQRSLFGNGFGSIYTYFFKSPDYSVLYYTDKPMYMAGDTVNFKAIVRGVNTDGLKNTAGVKIKVRVGDYYGYMYDGTSSNLERKIPLFEKEYTLDDFGSFSGSFVIPQSEKEESKQVTLSINDKPIYYSSLGVAKYDKPLYQYSVSPERDRYYVGESVKYTVLGTDYSGNPTSNKQVKVTLYYGSVSPDNNSGEYSGNGYYNSNKVDEKIVTLDANGKYEYRYTPLLITNSSPVIGYNFVVESADKEFATSGSASVLVSQVGNDLTIKPTLSGNKIGDTGEFTFQAKKLWEMSPLGGLNATVNIIRNWSEKYQSGTMYDPNTKTVVPEYSYRSLTENVVTNQQITTNGDGKATLQIPNLKEGNYTATANYSSVTVESGTLFVYGNTSWNSSIFTGISLGLSKNDAVSGDKVTAFVFTAEPGDYLIFSETGNITQWNKITTTSANQTTSVDFNITDQMYPYADICLVKPTDASAINGFSGQKVAGKFLGTDCQYVSVKANTGLLNIKITPDKQQYNPGDKVVLSIQTNDPNNNPVSAQVGVFAVDKSLIDLMHYSAYDSNPRYSMYSARLRRSILALSNYYSPGAGGMGSSGDGNTTRQDFKDSALWQSSIVTGNDGRANVEFTLPDNLTTWNLYAYGADKGSLFGYGDGQIRTNLTRFANIELPRFVRVSDKLTPFVEVSNYGDSFTGKIRITCTGCVNQTWESSDVDFPGNARKRVSQELEVQNGAKSLDVKIDFLSKNSNGEYNVLDSVAKKIPVYSMGQITNEVKSTILKDGTSTSNLTVDMGNDFRADLNDITLTVSKSYTIDRFDYPVDPSTKSSIQLAYGILQNSFIYKYYDELKPDISKEDLYARIKLAYEKLIGNQSKSGGFSWFGYDAVSMEASSLAAESIAAAKDSGVDVNPFVLSELRRYLSDIYKDGKYSIYDKATALLSISYFDPNSVVTEIYALRDQIIIDENLKKSPYLLTTLMQTFDNIGSFGDSSELVEYLRPLAKESDRGAYWDDTETNYRILGSNDYVTSLSYLALAPLEHWDLKAKVRNWMMDRKSSSYYSDQMYQRIVYSLAMADSQGVFDKNKPSELAIKVNGKDAGKISIAQNDPSYKFTMNIASNLLQGGDNTIEVTRSSGGGDLYVLASANKSSQLAPDNQNQNFTITKSYIDLASGATLNPTNIPADKMIKVHIEVTAKIDADNVIVRDQYAAGVQPKQLGFADISNSDYNAYYNSVTNLEFINKWGGNIYTDFVTFTEASMKKDKVYKYEYLAQAKFAGSYNGGLVSAGIELFPDVSNYKVSDGVEVK